MEQLWSIHGQSPEYLAATRMISLDDGIIATILQNLHLKPGMRVLDVGCGSGEYCIRLGSQTADVLFTGIDIDRPFVDFANARVRGEVGYPFETPNAANTYRFVCGDGLALPFEDASFDAVVSHTYLTAVPDWNKALDEMLRVCEPGGIVSSITSLTNDFYGSGMVWLFDCTMPVESAELVERVATACLHFAEPLNLTAGIAPRDLPAAFAEKLADVACRPLGHYFCLSDASVSPERYRRYIDLLKAEEESKLARALADPTTRELLPHSDWDTFAELIEKRHAELVAKQGRNDEWNWYGNSSLLACGIKS